MNLQDNVENVNNPIGCHIVHLNDVPHGEGAGDGDLVREGGDGELLPRPCDQGGGALREGVGEDASLGHVPEKRQLESIWVGQERLKKRSQF